MPTYEVLKVKHEYKDYDWMDAVAVDAEGPSQAAAKYAEEFHVELGHYSEDGCLRVRSDTNETWVFRYNFELVPQVRVRWMRDV